MITLFYLMKCWDACVIEVVETIVPVVTGNCSSLVLLIFDCGITWSMTGQQRMLTIPWHLVSPLNVRVCPMSTWFVCVVDILIIYTSVSEILICKWSLHEKSNTRYNRTRGRGRVGVLCRHVTPVAYGTYQKCMWKKKCVQSVKDRKNV